MTGIPKIVRRRLATNASAGEHPDANVLTAFAEQSLPNPERISVLAHLSQCGECREVVFLATQHSEVPNRVVPVRSGWLGWPALRWGALAACAVVVVAAVSLRPRSARMAGFSDASPQIAMKQESAAEQKAQIATEVQKDRVAMDYKAAPDVVRPDQRIFSIPENKTARTRAKVAAAAPSAIQADKLAASSAIPAAVPAQGKAVTGDLVATAKPAAPTPLHATEQVQVTAESAAVATDTAQPTPGKAKEALQGAYVNSPSESAEARRDMAAALAAGANQYAYKKLIPRWTLSADGTLQRSLDAGKTWKTIPVAADATFTAVAAMASDIWVGGSHGSLYHSVDAGDHWTQVIPASKGTSLTANIIGIEFPDSLHGKITTSSQEIWTTSDGGQSWQVSH